MKYHVNEKRAIGKRSPMLYWAFYSSIFTDKFMMGFMILEINCPMRKAFVKIIIEAIEENQSSGFALAGWMFCIFISLERWSGRKQTTFF